MKNPPNQQPKKERLGYPLMEKLIETEGFEKINQTFSACYDTLERMLKNKTGGLGRQKLIRQALQAYDLTIDLIRELLKVKYQMIKDKQEKKGENPSDKKK